MSDLYWILTLGDLHNFFVACLIVSAGLLSTLFVIAVKAETEGKEEVSTQMCKAIFASFCVLLLSILLTIAIPSKKELYMIYGVGNTIEYLKSKPNAKNLPDKCIKALERWADEVNKENNKDSE